MRVRSILIVSLLCAVAAFAFAVPDKVEESEGTGVSIETEPVGADVFIDGIRKGRTPLRIIDLRPGPHSLLVEKDGFRPRQETILVRETGRLSLSLELRELTGKIDVSVRPVEGSLESAAAPFDPAIFIDEARRESGVLTVSAGIHSVRARSFGWQDAVRTVRVGADDVVRVVLELRPAEFSVSDFGSSRRRFNPLDAGRLGSTEFAFKVSGPGSGRLTVAAKDGEEVFSRELGPFVAWDQALTWDGRDAAGRPLRDGEYEAVVRAVSTPPAGAQPAVEVKRLTVVLDSSVAVRPAAVGSSVAGAFYAPQARALPASSFQIEGSLLFGESYVGAAGDAPPYALGFRFVPAEGWEAGAAANLIASSSADAVSAFAASVRRALFRADEERPYSAGLAFRYAWISEGGAATPFAIGKGAQLDFPVELGAAGDRGFFLGLAPGLLWDERVTVVLAAAAGRRAPTYVAALSGRTTKDLGESGSWPVFLGAEYRFFPPPSTLVYGLIAGFRAEEAGSGFFGGLSLGILF